MSEYRESRIESFDGTATDLAEIFLFLRNAATHIVMEDKKAWGILYDASQEIAKELKKAL